MAATSLLKDLFSLELFALCLAGSEVRKEDVRRRTRFIEEQGENNSAFGNVIEKVKRSMT